MAHIPLAESVRPASIDEIIGQHHVLGDGKLLPQILKSGKLPNLIFWGPPGSGKTTLARIIARDIGADFIELSAVTSGKKDIEKVVNAARDNTTGDKQTVLFVDEIHRFNKAQQDAFLPHVEAGLITLIGATTENPSFEIISPLLSRSRVVVLEPLSNEDVITILQRAADRIEASNRIDPAALELLANISAGDARTALNTLELALSLSEKVTPETIKAAAGKRMPRHDKNGESHYNIISAFIKSLRGSSVDGALYYLARLVESGEDPKFIARRMVIFASEDIGLAGNGALALAVSCFEAVERIGMPESNYILFHTAAALAKSHKSRQTSDAMNRALALTRDYPDLPVPLHLRNAPTKLMKNLGYGKNYKWQAGFTPDVGFLPDEVKDKKIF